MSSPSFSAREVALDSCVLINLAATGLGVGALAREVGVALHITDAVAGETHYLLTEEPGGEREQIDVPGLVTRGELSLVSMSDAEAALYVQLASELDDGEASSIAIAASRGWVIATDDRKARGRAVALEAELMGTADLLRCWADVTVADPEQLVDLLRRVEVRARFTPARDDSNRDWWTTAVAS